MERLFRESLSFEAERFEAVQARLLTCATVIPLTSKILARAAHARQNFDLTGQDSVVFAAVVLHREQHPDAESCFLNRNSKDFEDPLIVEALNALGCKLLPKFKAGLGYVAKRL